MLPKNKLNYNDSTSLSNLNSVNNMMINYNSSNLSSSQSKLATSHTTTSDERYGCRALICDTNGIIIGEATYRCMVCSQIHDSIAETKQHYYENHSNEVLLGPSPNLSHSLNQNNCATTNGTNNFITNSILNNSLNSSLNNGLQLQFSTTANSHQQHNSNSLLNNETVSAKKRKNVSAVLDRIYNNKSVSNTKNSRQNNNNSTSLIQSTGNLSNYLNASSQKDRDLLTSLNNQLKNSLGNLNNLNFNNQLQLTNDDDDDEELDDQKSDFDQDEWRNNFNNLSNDLLNANNQAILDVINNPSLILKLNDNMTDIAKEMNNNNNKTKSSKLSNIFADNSNDQDVYSNTTMYENIMNLSNDSDNKEDLVRNIPPAVKLKRGSTTANVGKPGHVSCAVCGVVRYYSCVYRRYGQFTCQVCYRFFRTFFAKPNRYTCTNLGSCPLDVRVRCRACWIQACINLYSVDGQRKQILDTYRPLKASDNDILSTDNNNNISNINDMNQSMNNKHDLDDELDDEDLRSSKKVKTDNYQDLDDQQFSNGDDLIEEDDDEDIKQDQEEPLNYSSTKNASEDDDDLRDDES